MFRAQVAALQTRFRVINVDLRGHGESGDSTQPFTLYDLVDDVLAVLAGSAALMVQFHRRRA
jgi:pimeloyl-ACP methyl ester carboxylesterase